MIQDFVGSVPFLVRVKDFIMLLRVAHWAKNLFLYIPLFFAGELFEIGKIIDLTAGVIAFCLVASGVYILNDYKDLDKDRQHPVKKYRPLAAGSISIPFAFVVMVICLSCGLALGWHCGMKFLMVLAAYLLINLLYSFGLKKISILDILLIATGFMLRIKAGGILAAVGISQWLTIIVFLLALFLALGKRRDDLLIKTSSTETVRQALSGYNADFLNVSLAIVSAVMMMSYLMYTLSPEVIGHMGTYRLYYTSIFVGAGLMRYLQLIYVKKDTRSPTKVLYKDHFIQICIFLWVLSFYCLIYLNDFRLNHLE